MKSKSHDNLKKEQNSLKSSSNTMNEVEKQFKGAEKKLKMLLYLAGIVLVFGIIIFLTFALRNNGNATGDACSKLSNQDKDLCYLDSAKQTSNMQKCNLINNEKLKESCLSDFAIQNIDLASCRKLSSQAKGRCLKSIAEQKLDQTICVLNDDKDWQNSCMESLAVLKKDYSVCLGITNVEMMENCLSDLSKKLSSAIPCNEIRDVPHRDKCVLFTTGVTKNITECKFINDTLVHDTCVVRIATGINDSSLCDSAYYTAIKKDCYSKFNATSNANNASS